MSPADEIRRASNPAVAHVQSGVIRSGDRAAVVDLIRALDVHSPGLPEPLAVVAAATVRTLADGHRAAGPDGPAARRRAQVAARRVAEAEAVETSDNVVALRPGGGPDGVA